MITEKHLIALHIDLKKLSEESIEALEYICFYNRTTYSGDDTMLMNEGKRDLYILLRDLKESSREEILTEFKEDDLWNK